MLSLLLGYNAKGSSHINQRGENLLEFILNNKLAIYNGGGAQRRSSAIRCNSREHSEKTIVIYRVSDRLSMSNYRIIRHDMKGNSEVGEQIFSAVEIFKRLISGFKTTSPVLAPLSEFGSSWSLAEAWAIQGP